MSFNVDAGEILGIVGPNGSGKSTLLQIAAGILQPTSGRVSVEGRVAALLELGAGFNPEFSGRENVFLNSEILGLSRKETERIFPEIEAFAEIGEFIDRPVKSIQVACTCGLRSLPQSTFSPKCLIVDEALAVGDAIFANRCLQKLEELKDQEGHDPVCLPRPWLSQTAVPSSDIDDEGRDFLQGLSFGSRRIAM